MTKDAPAFDLPETLKAAAQLANEHGCEVRISKDGAIRIIPAGERKTSTDRVRAYRDRKRGNAGNSETHETHETHCNVSPSPPPASSPQVSPSPPSSPTPPPSPTPAKTAHAQGEPAFPADLPEPYRHILGKWWKHKRQIGKAYKPLGWETLVKQQRVKPIADLVRDVEHSIASNYAGIFPPHSQQSGNKPKNAAYNAATATAGMSGDDIGLFTPDQK